MQSFKEDLENGYLQGVRELVHAEVFTDFVEMAEMLIISGYKDPAAVIIGSFMENHLRQLAFKNGVPTAAPGKDGKPINIKAEALNTDLTKAGVYLLTNQKQVTAWIDLRSDAAHGHYANYTKEQIQVMIQGVIGFLAQFPV